MMRIRPTVEKIAESARLDLTQIGPIQRILNGDFSLVGAVWDVLSGGWTVATGLATNLVTGASASLQQTFAAPFTSPAATLEIGVTANVLGLSTVNAELVTNAGSVLAYSGNPSPGTVTVPGIVITSPATALRVYVTGTPGAVINSVSLIA